MLDSHPELVFPGEAHFVRRMLSSRSRYERDPDWPARLLADLSTDKWFRHWSMDDSATRIAVSEGRPDLPDAFRRLFSARAAASSKPRYGDKTPQNVLALPLLAEAFPEAKFIHIVRDGRDAALSLLALDWGPSDVASCALYWSRQVQAGRASGDLLGPHRYREVRYENLVNRPEESLRDLCAFLELEFDRSMLHPDRRAATILAAADQPSIHQGLHRPVTAGLRDWRTEMPARDVALFELVAGPALRAFGYPGAGRMPSAALADAYVRRILWTSRRGIRRIRRMVTPTHARA